ncbi:MAG: hypothetical protein ACQESP_12855, partial [Candidatus Muiribacteriota bacterium]
RFDLSESDINQAILVAVTENNELKNKALTSLESYGHKIEDNLIYLLEENNGNTGSELLIVNIIKNIQSPENSLLKDIKTIFTNNSNAEIVNPDLLALIKSEVIKIQLSKYLVNLDEKTINKILPKLLIKETEDEFQRKTVYRLNTTVVCYLAEKYQDSLVVKGLIKETLLTDTEDIIDKIKPCHKTANIFIMPLFADLFSEESDDYFFLAENLNRIDNNPYQKGCIYFNTNQVDKNIWGLAPEIFINKENEETVKQFFEKKSDFQFVKNNINKKVYIKSIISESDYEKNTDTNLNKEFFIKTAIYLKPLKNYKDNITEAVITDTPDYTFVNKILSEKNRHIFFQLFTDIFSDH